MEYMKHESWGQTYDLCIERNEYAVRRGMALQLYCVEDGFCEPFADLTVNLPGYLPGEHKGTEKGKFFTKKQDSGFN